MALYGIIIKMKPPLLSVHRLRYNYYSTSHSLLSRLKSNPNTTTNHDFVGIVQNELANRNLWLANPPIPKRSLRYLNCHQVEEILKLYMNPVVTLRFFKKMEKKGKCNINCHKILIKVLLEGGLECQAQQIRHSMIEFVRDTNEAEKLWPIMKEFYDNQGFAISSEHYDKLLRVLRKFNMVDTMEEVFAHMVAAGVRPTLYTYTLIIHSLCKNGEVTKAEWYQERIVEAGYGRRCLYVFMVGHCKNGNVEEAFRVFKEIGSYKYPQSANAYGFLIEGLCHAKWIDKAISVLRKMKRNGVVPTRNSFTLPIVTLCELGRLQDAIELFEEIPQRDNYHYVALISGLCDSGRLGDARNLLDRMSGDGLKPNVITINVILKGFCKEGKIDEVFEILERYKCTPNRYTYNAIILGLCVVGNLRKAMRVFDYMVKRGTEPDVVTFNCLIEGFCKHATDMKAAFYVFEMMKEYDCKSNVETYNLLIHGLCRKGELAKAYVMFQGMAETGVAPNYSTYKCLTDEFCKAGRIDKGMELVSQMEKAGLGSSTDYFHVRMHGLCKEGKMNEADALLREMKKEGLVPLPGTYNVIINQCFKSGASDVGFKYLDQMETENLKIDIHTYSILISGLCVEGKLERAELLLSEVKEKGIECSVEIYNSLIQGNIKLGRVDPAFDVLWKMLDDHCIPSIATFSLLLAGFHMGQNKLDSDESIKQSKPRQPVLEDCAITMESACWLIDKMREKKFNLTTEPYASLISLFSTKGRPDVAFQLYCVFLERGLVPNQNMYTSMIVGYCAQGKVMNALELYISMTAKGVEPSLVVFKSLIPLLNSKGKEEVADRLFESATNIFTPDEIIWSVLVDGFLNTGDSQTCLNLFKRMRETSCQPSPQSCKILMAEIHKHKKYFKGKGEPVYRI